MQTNNPEYKKFQKTLKINMNVHIRYGSWLDDLCGIKNDTKYNFRAIKCRSTMTEILCLKLPTFLSNLMWTSPAWVIVPVITITSLFVMILYKHTFLSEILQTVSYNCYSAIIISYNVLKLVNNFEKDSKLCSLYLPLKVNKKQIDYVRINQ